MLTLPLVLVTVYQFDLTINENTTKLAFYTKARFFCLPVCDRALKTSFTQFYTASKVSSAKANCSTSKKVMVMFWYVS